jgi:hypothetical protein
MTVSNGHREATRRRNIVGTEVCKLPFSLRKRSPVPAGPAVVIR